MYEELVGWLRSWSELPAHCECYESCEECNKQDLCSTFTNERIITKAEQAADAIEELSADCDMYRKAMTDEHNRAARLLWEKEHLWISVMERLPDAHKEVYVTDGEYIARANLLDEVFPGDQPCWSYSGLGKITHWCERIPLPEPPKEET